jgi:hypothetical protein
MVRLIAQILNGRRQHFHGSHGRIVGLDFEIDVVHQRVRMHVATETDGTVSQKLHTKQVPDGVIFLVKSKRSRVGDLDKGEWKSKGSQVFEKWSVDKSIKWRNLCMTKLFCRLWTIVSTAYKDNMTIRALNDDVGIPHAVDWVIRDFRIDSAVVPLTLVSCVYVTFCSPLSSSRMNAADRSGAFMVVVVVDFQLQVYYSSFNRRVISVTAHVM